MHNGHRGFRPSVKKLGTVRNKIKSRKQCLVMDAEGLNNSQRLQVTHVNLNDKTIEGFTVKDKKIFSVQYRPGSSPGLHDSRYIFDQFINLKKEN